MLGEAPGAQRARQNCACALAQRHLDVGPIASEALQSAGHYTRRGARERPKPNRPNADRVRAIELAVGLLHRLEGRGGVAEQDFGRGGEPNSLALAGHERMPRPSFQGRDPLRDRRLRVTKLERSRRKRTARRHRAQYVQISERVIRHELQAS